MFSERLPIRLYRNAVLFMYLAVLTYSSQLQHGAQSAPICCCAVVDGVTTPPEYVVGRRDHKQLAADSRKSPAVVGLKPLIFKMLCAASTSSQFAYDPRPEPGAPATVICVSSLKSCVVAAAAVISVL